MFRSLLIGATIVLVILKFTGYPDLSWWLVFSPLLLLLVISIIAFIFIFGVVFFVKCKHKATWSQAWAAYRKSIQK